MGTRRKVAALAAGIAVTVVSSASGARLNEADVELTFGEKGRNKSTSLALSVKLSSKGSEKNPGRLEITLPNGSEIDTTAAQDCDTTEVGSFDDCPQASRIGSGTATFGQNAAYDLHLTNGESYFTIWYEFGPGSYIPLKAEIDGRTVTAPYFALKSLKLKVDKTGTGGDALIRTPPQCPSSGKWTSTVKTTYYNEGGDQDDEVETDKPKTPCQG